MERKTLYVKTENVQLFKLIIWMFTCQAKAQISGYIMRNKFRIVSYPKVIILRVSLVYRKTIFKISLLQYLTPQQKKSSQMSSNNIWTTHLEGFVSSSQYVIN